MGKSFLKIELDHSFNLEMTALSHGWVNLDPYKWDHSEKNLFRKDFIRGQPITLTIKQPSTQHLLVDISCCTNIEENGQLEIISKVTRALNLDFETSEILPVAYEYDFAVAKFIERGGGRFLRGTTLFEDVVKTLFTTNASWTFTKKMVQNFVKEYGKNGSFPESTDVTNTSAELLKDRLRIGYRAKYLSRIVEIFNSQKSEAFILNNPIPGLGDYGRAHIRMLTNDFSKIPIDSEVRNYCKETLGCQTDQEIIDRFMPWKKYAFLGYKLGRQVRKINWIG